MSLLEDPADPCAMCAEPGDLVVTFDRCPGCSRVLDPDAAPDLEDERRWLPCSFDDPPPRRARRPDPTQPTQPPESA